MLVGHSMQGRGASLIFLFLSFSFFLLTPGEVISEEYTSDYGEAMWECGWMCLCHRIIQVKLRQFQKLTDSGGADVGDEDDRDEAKRMGETYTSMVLALYVGDPLVQMFLRSTPLGLGPTAC